MNIRKALAVIGTCPLAVGCANEKLTGLEKLYLQHRGYASVEANFCTQSPTLYRQRLKYVFVMDKSSSNQDPPDATDPFGKRRYAPLSYFVQGAQDDPGYTFYSLINFSDDADVVQEFTDDRSVFDGVVNSEWNANGLMEPIDRGFTNYIGALDEVENIIRNDVESARNESTMVTSTYVIVFISDGYPIVRDRGSSTGTTAQVYDPDIRNKITEILDLGGNALYKDYIDEIILHTGYYFETRDNSAEALLAQMAAHGGGETYQFGAGLNIDYNLFAVPIRNVRYLLTDVFVENASAVWWDDGRYLFDGDHDGLPDEIEEQYGSSADEMDSDGNGVSDLVEFRTKGSPCKSSGCNHHVSERDNYAACTGLLLPNAPDGSANPAPDGVNVAPWGTNYFGDSDGDGLNDCEEWILRSIRDEFDSNGDHVPDFIAFKNQLHFIPGMNSAAGDPDSDGVKNYSEIKLGWPLFLANEKIVNFKPMKIELRREDFKGGRDCYKLHAEDVATIGWDNEIKVYLVENTAIIDNKPRLRVAKDVLEGKTESILFKEEDFK